MEADPGERVRLLPGVKQEAVTWFLGQAGVGMT